jgi:predicted DCC family thiol-disulfide oxidoreductase YuxK
VSNGWTGGQYSVLRAIFGACLCVQFLRTIGWGAEGFSRVALLPDARSSPLARLLPNILDVWSSPAAAPALLAVGAALSLLLAIGWWDRTAAVGIGYLGACFFVRSPLLASAWLPVAGWLLLVHACLPPAPYGSLAALGRVDPAGAWRMPPLIFGAAWIVMALGYSGSGYAKLLRRSWVDGVWSASALELLFAPLALVAPLRPWLWLATLVVRLGPGALSGADAGPGLTLLHLLTFDPGWIRPRNAAAPERLFYDGTCGLCHRAVRFVLAEDRTGKAFRVAPLGGAAFEREVPAGARAGIPDSLLVVRADGTRLTRSAAVLHVAERIGGLWRALAIALRAVPAPLRDVGYDAVARVRLRLFARPTEACPLLPPHLRARFDA